MSPIIVAFQVTNQCVVCSFSTFCDHTSALCHMSVFCSPWLFSAFDHHALLGYRYRSASVSALVFVVCVPCVRVRLSPSARGPHHPASIHHTPPPSHPSRPHCPVRHPRLRPHSHWQQRYSTSIGSEPVCPIWAPSPSPAVIPTARRDKTSFLLPSIPTWTLSA